MLWSSDLRGAALMFEALPKTKVLMGDSSKANWLHRALADRSIAACIPSKVNRKVPMISILPRRGHGTAWCEPPA